MVALKGKSVFGGVAIGKIKCITKDEIRVKREKIADVEGELERFDIARETARKQLAALYDKALTEVGEVNAMIFEVHGMMLEDPDYTDSVKHIIKNQGTNAEYAVAVASDNFSEMFSAMENEYMRARASDIKDISNRLIDILQGRGLGEIATEDSVIILAEDLAPSETVQLDKEKVQAFVTRYGSSNSHTAILARTMNIPALIGVNYNDAALTGGALEDGELAIVDGYNGILYLKPDNDLVEKYQKKKNDDDEKIQLLQKLKGKPDETVDGTQIKLYANIGSATDVASVLANDASGIGLFRSEFLYLEKSSFPTEEEQFIAYKKVIEGMENKKVIIRTLDIGADKQVDYFNLKKEENPAMGYRAIRICLNEPEIFKTQLRAIYRASYYGTAAIMYPMIISVDEVLKIKAITDEVKKELEVQGIPYGDVEQGIMIETPAAVMISDELAREVDFFSIGTNDLTQYSLAVDRQNERLDGIYNATHEAIMRMIDMVVKNGHKENCWVGICGELAADLNLTERFIKMGIDELSVAPAYILRLREKIRSINLKA